MVGIDRPIQMMASVKSRIPRISLGRIVQAVLLVLLISWPLSQLWIMHQTLKALPTRYTEAKDFIEYVYAYERQNGRWPEEDDPKLVATRQKLLPPDWDYYCYSVLDREPAVSIGFAHHYLTYRFELPQNGIASRRWRLWSDSVGREFESDAPYALDGQ